MVRGFVTKAALRAQGAVATAIGKIYPASYEKYAPKMTCYCCGKTFLYRGLKDANGIAGLTYDFSTDGWVATQGDPVYCDDCLSIFSGGAYDGKKQYEVTNGQS